MFAAVGSRWHGCAVLCYAVSAHRMHRIVLIIAPARSGKAMEVGLDVWVCVSWVGLEDGGKGRWVEGSEEMTEESMRDFGSSGSVGREDRCEKFLWTRNMNGSSIEDQD